MGNMYARDFPDPVSDASKNSLHFEAGSDEKRCLRERDWIGVGFAFAPRISCTDQRSPSIKGGEVNSEGRVSAGSGSVDLSNSSAGSPATFTSREYLMGCPGDERGEDAAGLLCPLASLSSLGGFCAPC